MVELTEPIGRAPAGATGGLLEYYDDEFALVEVMEPDFDDVLDRLVDAPVRTLRICEQQGR